MIISKLVGYSYVDGLDMQKSAYMYTLGNSSGRQLAIDAEN